MRDNEAALRPEPLGRLPTVFPVVVDQHAAAAFLEGGDRRGAAAGERIDYQPILRRQEADEEGRQFDREDRRVSFVLTDQGQAEHVVGQYRLALGPARDVAAEATGVGRILPARVVRSEPRQARAGPLPDWPLDRLEIDVRALCAR